MLVFTITTVNAQEQTDEKLIKATIESTYVEVFCKKGDPEILRKSFHPTFRMYTYYKGEISVKIFEEWLSRLIKNRGKSKLDAWDITILDVTGNAASVRIKLIQDDQIKYTDYFTLYKLEDGWKIFTKTFNIH